MRQAEHLLVLPVPFRLQDGRLLIESQAHMGLERWLENFDTLLMAATITPIERCTDFRNIEWIGTEDLQDRVEFVHLPWSYRPIDFVRNYSRVRRVLKECIGRSKYLQFGIHAAWGDWASVAAEVALAMKRPYAVHMDNVSHEVVLHLSKAKTSWRKRVTGRMQASVIHRWHRRLIEHAGLALCHGADCYNTYRTWAQQPELVHNVHDLLVNEADFGTLDVDVKAHEVSSPLRVCYTGRAEIEKAPMEWVRAILTAKRCGANIKAVWLGNGSLWERMKAAAADWGLQDNIEFPGFLADRADVMRQIRNSHVMMFTHILPESPRCLIESLRCATPIVGYGSTYPADLIAENGGGILTTMGDPDGLGRQLAALAGAPALVGDLIRRAFEDGKRFRSKNVFEHRSDLIKRHLARFEG